MQCTGERRGDRRGQIDVPMILEGEQHPRHRATVATGGDHRQRPDLDERWNRLRHPSASLPRAPAGVAGGDPDGDVGQGFRAGLGAVRPGRRTPEDGEAVGTERGVPPAAENAGRRQDEGDERRDGSRDADGEAGEDESVQEVTGVHAQSPSRGRPRVTGGWP